MENLIAISTLNDFIFCPYSIYLHNVYVGVDKSMYQALPQVRGSASHKSIDQHTYSSSKNDLTGISVVSETLGVYGVIDLYKYDKCLLIERKYKIHKLYKGQIYQLYAQYYCMIESGFIVNELSIYSLSDNHKYEISLPDEKQYEELLRFIQSFRMWNPTDPVNINTNKCTHCIYASLCDKATEDHVY